MAGPQLEVSPLAVTVDGSEGAGGHGLPRTVAVRLLRALLSWDPGERPTAEPVCGWAQAAPQLTIIAFCHSQIIYLDCSPTWAGL